MRRCLYGASEGGRWQGSCEEEEEEKRRTGKGLQCDTEKESENVVLEKNTYYLHYQRGKGGK